MNLPVILDVALGLIFIFLILSLLASELQELITTLLQWRAKHLKKSIELLVAGGGETDDEDVAKAAVLVTELYKDPLINTLNQQAKEKVEKGFRSLTKTINPKVSEKKQSAPSYLPSETFAITLLETLKIPELINYVKNPSEEVKTNLYMILASYKELKTAVNNPESESYQKIQQIYGDVNDDFKLLVNELPDFVPDNLITSLSVLTQRSKMKIENIKEEVNQLKKEVETWFDRSMDRASGVYKRNAKGVAILIGLSVAIITNTDSFHILKRLSQDSAVRSAVTQSAVQQNVFGDTNARRKLEELLGNTSVPIGWQNINQQFEIVDYSDNQLLDTSAPYTRRSNINIVLIRTWQVFKLICGWIVSGLAIAMGAPFWFDILNKVVNVRNAGPKPVSYTQDQPPQK